MARRSQRTAFSKRSPPLQLFVPSTMLEILPCICLPIFRRFFLFFLYSSEIALEADEGGRRKVGYLETEVYWTTPLVPDGGLVGDNRGLGKFSSLQLSPPASVQSPQVLLPPLSPLGRRRTERNPSGPTVPSLFFAQGLSLRSLSPLHSATPLLALFYIRSCTPCQ